MIENVSGAGSNGRFGRVRSVPTDPFVSVELDDTPRHRQNLPAGVAYPPSRPARNRRPGELGAGQPAGPLLGAPGPNVGYARSLAARAADSFTLAPHEHRHDASSVVAEVAMKRAAQFGRAPVSYDVEIAVALFGYDGSASPDFASWRARLVHEADHHYSARRAAVDLVSEELLRRSPNEIRARVDDWRAKVASPTSS